MPFEGPVLSSLQNPQIKYARSLNVRRNRYRERVFLVEGFRLFSDALDAGAVPRSVFVDESRMGERLSSTLVALNASNVIIHRVTTKVIESISDTQTPQGLVAIFGFPQLSIQLDESAPLLVVADRIKDPGNLGTLMRAAAGAGVHALYASPETVDPYSSKVVRSAMGAHFRLPIRQIDWNDPPMLLNDCVVRCAAEASGDTIYDRVDWTEPAALIIGSEAGGISEQARRYATNSVSIPLQNGLESLNAAVAGAVILFEAARQRRTQ